MCLYHSSALRFRNPPKLTMRHRVWEPVWQPGVVDIHWNSVLPLWKIGVPCVVTICRREPGSILGITDIEVRRNRSDYNQLSRDEHRYCSMKVVG